MTGAAVGRALRVGGALVVVAATGAVVAGATWLAPAARPTVPDEAVEVPPQPATLVCPGPLVLPESVGDGAFDPMPVDPVTRVSVVAAPPDGGALTGSVLPLGDGAPLAQLTAGSGATTVAGPTEPVVVRADGAGAPVRLAGTTAALVTDGDLRGLAAATCEAPSADAWLVGGSTAVGSTADLVLVNPGSTTAEVSLAAWGPNGPVEVAGGAQLVAPHAQRVVHLGGLVVDQRALALHVSTTGGQVAAYLQDNAVRGFTPAGTDLVVPGAQPATRQVVPGVLVDASTADSPDAPVLRLLAPGAEATTATVTLLGADGPVALPGAASVDLPAGQVTDLPLGGLPAGAYTVVVDAGQPVAAAVSFSRVGRPGDLDTTPRVERAWAAATAPGGGLVATAPGTSATLVVGAVPAAGDSDGAAAGAGDPSAGAADRTGDGAAVEGTAPSGAAGAGGARDGTSSGGAAPEATGDAAGGAGGKAAAGDAGGRAAAGDDEAARLTGTLRLLGAGGVVLDERHVSIDPSSTGSWALADLVDDPASVTGVLLLPDEGSVGASWAIVAQRTQKDGVLASVLLPAPDPATASSLVIRQDPTLALG